MGRGSKYINIKAINPDSKLWYLILNYEKKIFVCLSRMNKYGRCANNTYL